MIIAYNTGTPFLFQKTLGYSPSVYGWLTFIIAGIYYLSTTANRFFLKRFKIKRILEAGITLMFIAGMSMLLIKLFFNALNLYVVFIPLMIATFGQALVWSVSVAVLKNSVSAVEEVA